MLNFSRTTYLVALYTKAIKILLITLNSRKMKMKSEE